MNGEKLMEAAADGSVSAAGRFGVWRKSVPLFEAYFDADSVNVGALQEAGLDYEDVHPEYSDLEGLDDDLREAGTTSDFATYLNDKATKRVMWSYNEVSSSWRRWTRRYEVPDFKPISFVRLTEMQDLLPVEEGGEYKDSKIAEIVGPSLSVNTFGRLFSLSRRAIINDDMNQLRDRPAAMGRAAARTLAKDAVKPVVENRTAYDSQALFHANHGNLLSLALSEDALGQAMTKMRIQTDPNGNRIGLVAKTLVIPPELQLTARRILNSTSIPQPSQGSAADIHATTVVGRGGDNPLQGAIDYVVEDYLTDPNDWYVFASPEEAPVTGVGFLNGVETPDIFLNDPGMENVLRGRDPYTMRFDEIWWKIRHEWGTGVFDWRGAVKSAVA
jgi:hypothetical protein